jgi:hypothetical protein
MTIFKNNHNFKTIFTWKYALFYFTVETFIRFDSDITAYGIITK